MKNALPKARFSRRKKDFEIKRPVKSEKPVFLKLIGLLAAIIAAAFLLSLIVVWQS